MASLRTQMPQGGPGLRNPKCDRYKWVARGFWDFQLHLLQGLRAGNRPGISYEADATALPSRES
eukprot:8380890-Lingulodinium_polyedra.AAC.1